MDTKICYKCKLELSLDEFNKNLSKKDGLDYACRSCMNKYRENKFPEYAKTYYINKLAKKGKETKRCLATRETESGRRVCKKCEKELPLEEFIACSVGRLGRILTCNTCRRAARNNRHYGINHDTYFSIKVEQNNSCAICGKEFTNKTKSNIDHDHNTGRIRGLLCTRCNIGIGQFRDDIKLMEKATEYLRKNQSEPEVSL